MPTYVYEILDADGSGTGETFEHVQPMSAEALSEHPESGKPVRRVPQAPAIAGSMSPLKGKAALSDKNLEKLGMTKYKRQSDGSYEKTAGKEGPRHIRKQK